MSDFARIYAERLEISQKDLEQLLWGDFYYNSKKKCAVPGAQEKAKKPMFVQFVLENIWSLYDIIAVRKDKEKLRSIAERLGIKLQGRDLRITDPKAQIKTLLGQWLPIDRTVLEMVVRHVPAPNVISDERAKRLLFPENVELNNYPEETLLLKDEFKCCNSGSKNIIVFVSKVCCSFIFTFLQIDFTYYYPQMTPVHVSQLPQNKEKRLTEDELRSRREEVRRRIEERKQAAEKGELENLTADVMQLNIEEVSVVPSNTSECQDESKQEEPEKSDYVFVAFARIFSGTLRPGMRLYNLTPKHDPRNKEYVPTRHTHITFTIISL